MWCTTRESRMSRAAPPMTGRARLLTMGLVAIAASSWQSCSNESTGPGSSAVASVAVTPAVATIGPTDTLRLVAVAKDAAGNTLTGRTITWSTSDPRSEEHTSELQSQSNLVCRLLLEKKKTEKHIEQHNT